MWPSSRYSRRNSWYCWLISGRDCNLPSIRVCRAVAICNESPIAIGGLALNGSLTMYLPPAVRECVETKWFSHYSSSSLRGSCCGTSSSSQNLRSKMLVSHSAVQSDTWALSGSGGATPAEPESSQKWFFGLRAWPTDLYRDRLIPAIHTNQLRLANESVVYSLDLDPPAENRVIVATIRNAELLKLYII